jgi:hypothetical protein
VSFCNHIRGFLITAPPRGDYMAPWCHDCRFSRFDQPDPPRSSGDSESILTCF